NLHAGYGRGGGESEGDIDRRGAPAHRGGGQHGGGRQDGHRRCRGSQARSAGGQGVGACRQGPGPGVERGHARLRRRADRMGEAIGSGQGQGHGGGGGRHLTAVGGLDRDLDRAGVGAGIKDGGDGGKSKLGGRRRPGGGG